MLRGREAQQAIFVHITPGSGLTFRERGRWVIVTGHVNDAASSTCHFVYPDASAETYPDTDAQARCAGQFVMTSIRPSPAPSIAP